LTNLRPIWPRPWHLASSSSDRPVHADMAFVGEIGLSGELRAVSQIEARLREAYKLGFKRCAIPMVRGKKKIEAPEGLQLIECRSLADALEAALVKG
jgi:DNA repair protein RadA/Sms